MPTQVDASFEPAEGAQLTPQLQIGKPIGSGSTADVFKLEQTGGSLEGKQGQAGQAAGGQVSSHQMCWVVVVVVGGWAIPVRV